MGRRLWTDFLCSPRLKRTEEEADDLFQKALAELEKYGAIIKSEDAE